MSLTVAATVFGCILLTVLAFLFADFRQAIESERLRLENTAAVFAAAVAEPVREAKPELVRNALRAIREVRHVRHVGVWNRNDGLIAEMGGGTSLDAQRAPVSELGILSSLFLNQLTVTVPVKSGGQIIASLALQADIGWIGQAFGRKALSALLLASIGILLAFLMAFRRVAAITAPLSELAKSFADIGSQTDLSRRIAKVQDDEVGVLINAFNEMFDRIGERDAKLKMHRDTLEQTVSDRTRELIVAKDDAERANAAKSEFLAMVGHEIRTPMNGMMVMAEMLAAAPLGPRHLRYAEIINRSGRNLLSIINDILDLSKIEAGRLDLETAPFSLDALVDDVAGLFTERAREKGLALTFAIDPNVPAKLRGDATRLTQIITNLVNNALKFTERGGVVISVSSNETDDPDRALLEIRVRDTGIGIAPNKLEHVFERFAQADQSITRRFGGTGLGLAISRRLVEAMDGTISVESREGRGSAFIVRLALPIQERAEALPSLAGKTIAIAQADPVHREALRGILRGMGAVVTDLEQATGATNADAVLVERDTAFARAKSLNAPLIWLSPRAGALTGGLAEAGANYELSYPLQRVDCRDLAKALTSGNFSALDANARAGLASVSLPDFRGLSALVVDDNSVNREVLKEALVNMGARVMLAIDGAAAFSQMCQTGFDIVFMDCSMPVMDGFAATRKWRAGESGPRLPIVALTAYVEGSAGDDWRLAGMDDYITKPFTIPSVAQAIIRHLPGRFADAASAHEQASLSTDAAAQRKAAHVPLLDPQTIGMIAKLSARSGKSAAQRIFQLFIQHAPVGLGSLEQAVFEARHDDVKGLAHALRSMCTSAGASRLAFLAHEAENQCQAGQPVSAGLLLTLSETLQASISAFNEMLAPDSEEAAPMPRPLSASGV